MKIYVNYKPKNSRDLLQWFFKPEVDGAYGKGQVTYNDEACKIVQCTRNRYRSYDDIYAMCKTYFPGISTRSLTHYLLTLDFKCEMYSKPRVLYPFMHSCVDMRRIRVFYHYGRSHDEFSCGKFDSQWDWNYLLGELGIKTEDDITRYIEIEKKKVLERTLV